MVLADLERMLIILPSLNFTGVIIYIPAVQPYNQLVMSGERKVAAFIGWSPHFGRATSLRNSVNLKYSSAAFSQLLQVDLSTGSMSSLLVVVLLCILLFSVIQGVEEERFIPDECFQIGVTCVRKQERMWMVDDIPHYWGSVLTFTGGAVTTSGNMDENRGVAHDNNEIRVGSALLTNMSPEWSRLFDNITLDVLKHDSTNIRVASPVDDSIASMINFVLHTGIYEYILYMCLK